MAFFQADTLWINRLAEGVAVLVLDVPDSRVNVLNERVFTDLEQALERIALEPAFKLLIIRSGKPGSFCAGADLREFSENRSAQDYQALSARGQQVLSRLADFALPTVAVIAGACLGGGLELALACDYRVVLERPDTRLGMPEIELGLIPGWGGTQRLPRVIGLERALQIILGGRRLSAADAHRWGLADEITVADDDEPPPFLDKPVKRWRTRLPLLTWRQRLLESNFLGRSLIFRGARRLLKRRLADDMPAPWEALHAVEVGMRNGMAAGLACEREAIGRLVATPACRNLAQLFRLREQARKVVPESDGSRLQRIGVVGCGTMGAGIVQLAVIKGCDVVVREADELSLGTAMLRLMGLLQIAVNRGALPAAELERALSRIHGTVAWKGFDQVDLVIEAVVEDLDKKRKLFREMEDHVRDSTILASNTSSLRIQELQQGLGHPERIAGLHFFNPVHKMPLVEVVGGPNTNANVISALMSWAIALGKTPVQVKDSPGFLVNRILMPYLNEAMTLVGEGVDIALVDRALHRFGMPLGPLEVLDQVGLDVAAHIARSVQPAFGERFQIHPGFQAMAERGLLGQKSGAGFYRHRGKRKKVNSSAAALVQAAAGGATSLEPMSKARRMAMIRDRLVGLMVQEAQRCLDEKLVADADTLDLAMVLGAGWAPHRGGPLWYGEENRKNSRAGASG